MYKGFRNASLDQHHINVWCIEATENQQTINGNYINEYRIRVLIGETSKKKTPSGKFIEIRQVNGNVLI